MPQRAIDKTITHTRDQLVQTGIDMRAPFILTPNKIGTYLVVLEVADHYRHSRVNPKGDAAAISL